MATTDKADTDAGISEGLSSRSAENLFWVGRYAERAEGQARLLRIVLDKAKMGKMGLETSRLGQVSPATLFTETFGEDARKVSELTYLRSMLRSLTGLTSSHPGFANKSEQSLESELLSIMLDPENSGSLVSTLQALVSEPFSFRFLSALSGIGGRVYLHKSGLQTPPTRGIRDNEWLCTRTEPFSFKKLSGFASFFTIRCG